MVERNRETFEKKNELKKASRIFKRKQRKKKPIHTHTGRRKQKEKQIVRISGSIILPPLPVSSHACVIE